ncbi:MAG: WD40/YVTN/BNR-like repeat-containing protein [Planctomycetota bacterium]|jgi:photosystem II stability/assembly factor-like uncharacterized protein
MFARASSLVLMGMILFSSTYAQPDNPAYLFEPWLRMGGPPGGVGYDIRMRPDSASVMYVTDSGAGIFKSIDGGDSWVAVNDSIDLSPDTGVQVFCATVDPHDPNTVWIGTQFTAQIYRSTNGGQSWHRRDSGIIPVPGEHSVRGITVDPSDPNTVYAGLEEPLASSDGISRTKGEVYKSTDAGLSWNRIWHGQNLARYIWVDPQDSQRLYVSTGIFDRNAANSDSIGEGGSVGILRSTTGGTTWTVLDSSNGLGGTVCPSLFMNPHNSKTLLAAISGQEGVIQQAGAFVTRDGGDTWQLSYPMGTAEAVEIAESDTTVWYVASVNLICRSDDAGGTWNEYPMETAHRGAGTPIDLQVDPINPYRVFVNSYGGGNMMSIDGGETWVDASRGYTGAAILGIAASPLYDRDVLAGANNATWLSDDGGETWRGTGIPGSVSSGAVRIVSHKIGPSSAYTLATGGFDDGNVYRSTNFGMHWESSLVIDLEAFEQGAGVPPETRYGARAFAVAPSNTQKVYVGYSERSAVLFSWGEYQGTSPGFFRSFDGGVTWAQVQNVPFDTVSVLTLAVHPFDEGIIYASSMNGVYRSVTGGDSWEHLDSLETVVPLYPTEGLPPIYVVAIDPLDPDVIYAGSPRGGVFRSDDSGATWVAAGQGMDPNEEIADILPDPNRPGVIYASARNSRVFVSIDRAQNWQILDEGYPIGSGGGQLALSEDGSVLYAGTGTSGVFRLGNPDLVTAVGDPVPTHHRFDLAQNYPNPLNSDTAIRYTLRENSQVKLLIVNVKGEKIATLVNERQAPGTYSVRWDGRMADGVSVASGVYFYRLAVDGQASARKMVVLR